MPWVNTTAADRAGDVLYADHSVVPNVPDDLVAAVHDPDRRGARPARRPARPRRHPGARAAAPGAPTPTPSGPGIFGPKNLPSEIRRDWVMNANDSYWLPNPKQPLEGYAGIIGCEQCERTLRTRMVYRYVLDRLAGTDGLASNRKVSPAHAARRPSTRTGSSAPSWRAQNGDLDTVCEAADGGASCPVLHRVGRALRHRQRRHADLPGVLEARRRACPRSGRCRSTRPTR